METIMSPHGITKTITIREWEAMTRYDAEIARLKADLAAARDETNYQANVINDLQAQLAAAKIEAEFQNPGTSGTTE